MTKKFFTNCLILNPADKTCMKGSVLVDGTVISAVGADLQEPSDAEVIDLQGMTLMPGLFNCHTHLTNGHQRETPPAILRPSLLKGRAIKA